jgi:cell division protein FtsL
MATAPKTQTTLPVPTSLGLPVILTVAVFIIGLTAMLPLIQSSGATSTAGNIEELEQDKSGLQARLRELEIDVATLGSLTRIESEAINRLGMEKPKDVQYIPINVAPPAERKLPSRFLPSEPETTAKDESTVFDDLFGWLP